MPKAIKYFMLFLGVIILALAANLFCLFGVLPYIWWRWSLGISLVLLAAVWVLLGRAHRADEELDILQTPPQKIIAGIFVISWCISFFSIIFQNNGG